MTAKPFEGTPEHHALTALAGTWAGPTKTWFDPPNPPEETTTRATIEALHGGRWIRIAYEGTAMNRPHTGHMIVGYHRDAAAHELVLIDSFHTGTSIMFSTGAPPAPGVVNVLGSYAAGEVRWGWRTVISERDGELTIACFNVLPDGHEEPAIETRLRRA